MPNMLPEKQLRVRVRVRIRVAFLEVYPSLARSASAEVEVYCFQSGLNGLHHCVTDDEHCDNQ